MGSKGWKMETFQRWIPLCNNKVARQSAMFGDHAAPLDCSIRWAEGGEEEA